MIKPSKSFRSLLAAMLGQTHIFVLLHCPDNLYTYAAAELHTSLESSASPCYLTGLTTLQLPSFEYLKVQIGKEIIFNQFKIKQTLD